MIENSATQTIRYVAEQPGIGKTSAALAFLADFVRRGFDGEDVGYAIYVAPTRTLLRQSFGNLYDLVDPQYRFMLHIKCGKGSNARASNVLREIEALLDEKQTSSRAVAPFCQGSVLFITHAAFLLLRGHEKFNRTQVIFDEARKWVQLVRAVPMNSQEIRAVFEMLFETKPLEVRGRLSKKFITLHPRPISSQKLASLRPSSEALQKAFDRLKSMYKELAPRDKDDIVRMRMFGALTGKDDAEHLVKISLPSHPFRGFARVWILAADFTTSQMHALLKWEGCELLDRTESFLDRWSPGGYIAARKAIERRQTSLTIVPLLNTDRMPAKNQFDRGVILPTKNLRALKDAMWKTYTTTPGLQDVAQHLRDPQQYPALLNGDQISLVKAMKKLKCEPDMLGWMLQTSERLLDAWWKKHPPSRTVNRLGDLQTVPGMMVLNNDFSEEYINKVKTLRYELLPLGEVEGRNDFRGTNVVAFLSAVNPEQVMMQLLNALLDDYEAEEDFVVDRAIQAIGRGNIRDHDSNEKMLAIVPTLDLAKRICRRMKNRPTLALDTMKRLGDYTLWSLNCARRQTEDEHREKNRAKRMRAAENEHVRKLESLMSKRARRRARLRNSISKKQHDELLLEISQLEKQIVEVRKLIKESNS
jgi:hypothetical protein